MPAIEVENLTKRYGARTAIDSISFTVPDGSVVGFLGPNGAGKSTTLRILTCFQPATSGTARVAGYDVFTQGHEVRENMCYLPESTPLDTEMRVRRYLEYRATIKGVARKERDRAVDQAMERCHVADVQDRIIGHLSKGYRQRVGLADALVHKPRVLILDEPTSGLDPNQVRDVRDLIKEIAGDTTILFSTHTIPWVEQVCTRVIVIHQGRIVREGTLDELRAEAAPWSRVEFHTNLPVADALEVLGAFPRILFFENVTISGETSLRYLVDRTELDASRAEVREALARRSGEMREERVAAGSLEDLFTTLTRGSERAEIRA
jgi:gliding motility-associated transport system ATP-binding protein